MFEDGIKFKGIVDKILFPKAEYASGDYLIFTVKVLEVLAGEEPVTHSYFKTTTLKGNVPYIECGDEFTFTINKPEVSKYGTSYSVVSVTKDVEINSAEKLESYFKLIAGSKVAKELIKVEGAYQLLMDRNNEALLKIKGIGESKLKQIYKNIGQYSDYSSAYMELEPLGLSRKMINKICMALGGALGAIEVCKKNPYSLVDKVTGIGFKMADTIAIKCGIDLNSEIRIESALLAILKQAGENGKTYLTSIQIIEELKKLGAMDLKSLSEIVQRLNEKQLLVLSTDGTKVALVEYLKLEWEISCELKRLAEAKSVIEVPENYMETIRELEEAQGWNYTDEQLKGIEMVLKENVVVVAGKAGTGKSTITNAMINILENYDIEMCCLSAKACQRLQEVTGGKVEAKTIHRLIGLGYLELEGAKLFADVIILDEASMPSGSLYLKLLKAIKNGAKLIIIGDDGQLAPIGDCSVFSDLLKSDYIKKIRLTKIHRQAEKSAIITKSLALRNQQQIYEKGFKGHRILGELNDLELFIYDESMLLGLVKKKFIEDLEITKDVMEVQVVTTLKSRGAINTHTINLTLQEVYNPHNTGDCNFKGKDNVKILKGDKVINLKNNYKTKSATTRKTTPIFNGSIGIVKDIEDNYVVIDFMGTGDVIVEKSDYNNINLAYAITCHSAQGSQWKRVIATFDMASYIMLNVEMLYTILTRASEHCSLISDNKSVQQAIKSVEQNKKQTLLLSFLP